MYINVSNVADCEKVPASAPCFYSKMPVRFLLNDKLFYYSTRANISIRKIIVHFEGKSSVAAVDFRVISRVANAAHLFHMGLRRSRSIR